MEHKQLLVTAFIKTNPKTEKDLKIHRVRSLKRLNLP